MNNEDCCRFRLNGLEFREYGKRIMKKIFENTPFQTLYFLFDGPHNCYLFGKDAESITAVIRECKKYPWIEPLGST